MINLKKLKAISHFSKQLETYSDNNTTLTYQLGKCNLQDLINYKFKNNIEWTQSDIIYLTATFLKMIYTMMKSNLF